MHCSIILLLTLLITFAAARNVKFSVVSFGTKVEVKIDNKSYPLTKIKNSVPLYQSTIKVSDAVVSYKYVVDGVSESFTRSLKKGETTTHNEFFGRKDTIKKLYQIPSVYKWTKSVGKGELFDETYIPTVHISGDRSETLFTTSSSKSDYLEKVAFILKDNVYTFKSVPCYPKNKKWNKMQFKLELNKDGIEGRYVLKFRDNNEDPAFMRQLLYGDIMNAIGYPTIQSVAARVYVNGRAVGYYVLQEEAASDSFVRSAFHGDNHGHYLITDNSKLGQSFDCSTGADFYYTGNGFYSFNPMGNYDRTRVKMLAKAFENLNTNNKNAVSQFEKNWFDIDTFFKGIAMEYLTAHWDSYWFYSTNFALYNNPNESTSNTYKFYFICQDWDGTFGLNAGETYMHYSDYINHSYKDYVNVKWGSDEYDSPKRFAIDKLLSNATLRARFENILKTIVIKVFNPVIIGKRLDALVARHRDEVAWNYDVCNVNPIRKGTGEQLNWNMNDFNTNIETASRHGANFGIKEFVYLRAKNIKKEFGINVNLGSKTYKERTGSSGVDMTCGSGKGKCPAGYCCSPYGYCGLSADHCGAGCQSAFGTCSSTTNAKPKTITTTTTKKAKTSAKKTTTTTTKKSNAKATTKANTKVKVSTNGRCGASYGKCPNNQCCSKKGYCGTGTNYCKTGCQKSFGICK